MTDNFKNNQTPIDGEYRRLKNPNPKKLENSKKLIQELKNNRKKFKEQDSA